MMLFLYHMVQLIDGVSDDTKSIPTLNGAGKHARRQGVVTDLSFVIQSGSDLGTSALTT